MQGEYYSYNLTATDPDNTFEELTFSDDSDMFVLYPSANEKAEIAFMPRNEHVGTHRFNVTVRDPGGLNDTMELELFIENVNDPPNIIVPAEVFEYEDVLLSFNLTEYFLDPDLDLPPDQRDSLTYGDDSSVIQTDPITGQVVWDTPRQEDVGEHYFRFTATDRLGLKAELTVLIIVMNTNDPPQLGRMSRQVLRQDRLYVFTVPYSDDDFDAPDYGEVLTFSNDPQGLFVINRTTGRIKFMPENQHVGEWQITIRVFDLEGAYDTQTVYFMVINKNDPPKLAYIPTQHLIEGQPYELQVMCDDPDLAERVLDGAVVNPEERLTFRTNSTRVPVDSQSGIIRFTPTNEDAMIRTFLVRITVTDAGSESMSVDVHFIIENVNDPPTDVEILGLSWGQVVQNGTLYTLTASAKDIDNEEGDLTYEWYIGEQLRDEGMYFIWEPMGYGPTPIDLVVTDPEGERSGMRMPVVIGGGGNILIWVKWPGNHSSFNEGESIRFLIKVYDDLFPPSSEVTISVDSNISGEIATILPGEPIMFEIEGLPQGNHRITFNATDGETEASAWIDIRIIPDLPTTSEVTPLSVAIASVLLLLLLLVLISIWRIRLFRT